MDSENQNGTQMEVATPVDSPVINFVGYDPKNRTVVMTKEEDKIVVHKKATGMSKEFESNEFENANNYFKFLCHCSHNQ
jgi:hypothetical protein